MALLTLSSTNKAFSFELNKNPKSGLQALELREGTVFGFFSRRAKSYSVYFQDNPLKCSFNEEQTERGDIEYNDLERYTSPLCYLAMLDKAISIKESNTPSTEVFTYSISINAIRLNGRFLLESFKKDLRDTVEIEEKLLDDHPKYKSLVFTNKSTSIYNLLQVVKIFLLLASQANDRDIRLDDAQIEKYLKQLVTLDLNYQLRSLFKNKFLTPNLFKKNRELLNTSAHAKLDLKCNNNFFQRRDFILDQAITDYKGTHILDIGCGEGNYMKPIYKRLIANNFSDIKYSYSAVDANKEALEQVRRAAAKNQFAVLTFESVENFMTTEMKEDRRYTIICTEVIEHNTLENTEKLLAQLKCIPFKQLILTTPNKAFNTFYNMADDEVRDADHKYELEAEEFRNLLSKVFTDRAISHVDLGDTVNDISSTLGAIIT